VQTRRLSRIFHLSLLSLATVGTVFALSACGSSAGKSGNASQLLDQTFGGSHAVNSGNLSFSLTVNPGGSSTLTRPISLSFGGPFQSLGKGKLPASNFSIGISAQGHSGALSILSTGTNGYVTLQGTSYQLPAATFQKLESSFAQVSASGGGSGSGALAKLGISPLRWLVHPAVVGQESVGGASTTHIRAGVDVNALLTDLNTFLQKASSTGVSGAGALSGGIPSSTRSQIAGSVHNPTVDVWTGVSDKTLRRMSLNLTVPVTGQLSTLLGGLRTAQIGLDMKYANLNQPQSITAPSSVRPFSEFQSKLQSFLGAVQGAAGQLGAGALGSGSTGSGSTGSGSTGSPSTAGSGSSATVQKYSACLQAAGSDVTKMQKCASLLGGG
jgi:hypothetical protein